MRSGLSAGSPSLERFCGRRWMGMPKRLRSRTRKPMMKDPLRLAQRTRLVTGASGYCVMASIPMRARVPRSEKKISQEIVYRSLR